MIYVMLAPGFEEIEALAFVDILRRADIDVNTVSIDNTPTVTGSHNITIVADVNLKDIKSIADGIVLPGGLPGTYNLQNNETVTNMLQTYNNSGKIVAAICAAPSVLGQLELLKNKYATCYPSFEEKLIGANVISDRVVADGNIITSRGAGTAHDFAFKFVEILKGKDKAKELRSSMLYD